MTVGAQSFAEADCKVVDAQSKACRTLLKVHLERKAGESTNTKSPERKDGPWVDSESSEVWQREILLQSPANAMIHRERRLGCACRRGSTVFGDQAVGGGFADVDAHGAVVADGDDGLGVGKGLGEVEHRGEGGEDIALV